MGLYIDTKVDLHMMFIDLEKVYDRVSHDVLWRYFEKKGVPHVYIRVIKDMYKGGMTSVMKSEGVTNDLYVGMSLHQGSALNPFIFTLIMGELTKWIQDELS